MAMTFGQFSEANRARCESPQGFNHPLSGFSIADAAADVFNAKSAEIGYPKSL